MRHVKSDGVSVGVYYYYYYFFYRGHPLPPDRFVTHRVAFKVWACGHVCARAPV